MDSLIYYFARAMVAALQSMPVTWVARLGRFGGGVFYHCDARHRRVAIRNMTMCLGGDKSADEIKALALENFKRIGENFACAVKTISMNRTQLTSHVDLPMTPEMRAFLERTKDISAVFAIGHFGNFETLNQTGYLMPTHKIASTYRAIKPPSLDRLLLRLRESPGSLLFERRTQGGALRAALREKKLILGLLADQHSGDHGLRLPFLGHDCNTSKAPAVFALRFGLPLYAAICYRTSLAHWRIEVSDEIPTVENGQPRSLEAIMLDVNKIFEAAVRRDPANWFWVHNRWKQSKLKNTQAKSSLTEDETGLEERSEQTASGEHAG